MTNSKQIFAEKVWLYIKKKNIETFSDLYIQNFVQGCYHLVLRSLRNFSPKVFMNIWIYVAQILFKHLTFSWTLPSKTTTLVWEQKSKTICQG